MSRHTIPAKEPRYTVTVGYDFMLNELFAQVYDANASNPDWPVFEIENTRNLVDLRDGLRPYANLTAPIIDTLANECGNQISGVQPIDHRKAASR